MLYLKQSTAVTVKVGPFLDDSDGKTAETALTISQADVRLSKNGGDIAQKNDATSCTHDELGIYGCPLDATDTNTLGRLQLWVAESGALPVWHEYMVVTAHVYDTFCSTDYLQVDVIQVGGATEDIATETKQDVIDSNVDAILVDTGTTLETHLTDIKGGTFSGATDSLEAVRDRGDAAWITATGFSTHAAADVWTVATRALTDKAGFSLSTAGVDAIIDDVIEGSLTLRQAIRIYLAALAGKSAGGGTATITFRDNADSKNRISATVDSDGNRTAVTLDGS